jgi:hypothetical protein
MVLEEREEERGRKERRDGDAREKVLVVEEG